MPAGGNVHVNATNIKNGTTVNLQITQNATPATLDFASYIKFESGSAYTVSTGSGNVDLVSFVTFDTTNLLAAGINHMVGYSCIHQQQYLKTNQKKQHHQQQDY
jgi:hypothetical protein